MIKKLNLEISELIGAHIGDGTLYKTNTGMVWELRGSLTEKEYYYHNIVPLLDSIFNIKFKPKFRSGGKNGCFGIQTSKKEVISFFMDYGFNPGRKTNIVEVLDYIKKSNNKIKLAFIRGYFDTDGCLRFDKCKYKVHKYPKIELASVSEQMIMYLSKLLLDLGFNNYTWKDSNTSKLCVAGKKMLEKWIKNVQPKNTKHLNKYYLFQKKGFVPPNAAVAQSGTAQIP